MKFFNSFFGFMGKYFALLFVAALVIVIGWGGLKARSTYKALVADTAACHREIRYYKLNYLAVQTRYDSLKNLHSYERETIKTVVDNLPANSLGATTRSLLSDLKLK